MIVNSIIERKAITDTELVGRTLEGDTDAFAHIVSRYQSLICSLTYSATGSLGQSQDLAQETFITAWKHLRLLRERDKLRAWLCGIARGLIGKALRRDGHEPVHKAEPLDLLGESADAEPLPSERAISQEEEAILWRSLERIPEIYREPLILFYREHQSVETVANESGRDRQGRRRRARLQCAGGSADRISLELSWIQNEHGGRSVGTGARVYQALLRVTGSFHYCAAGDHPARGLGKVSGHVAPRIVYGSIARRGKQLDSCHRWPRHLDAAEDANIESIRLCAERPRFPDDV